MIMNNGQEERKILENEYMINIYWNSTRLKYELATNKQMNS